MAHTYRYIGKTAPRRDATDIVTGGTKFLNDIKQIRFPDMLYGKVLRSPHPHALIKKVDKARALKLKGVKAVLTWEDVPDWKAGTPRIVRILDRKVRYVGDAVALIAATSEEVAREALGIIDVEYEILPAVYDVEEALKPDAPQLYEELPGNVVTPGHTLLGPKGLTEIVIGDVEKGFEEADVITEGTFGYEGTPNPMPPEPPGVVALWEEPNKVDLWVVNQFPYLDKITLYFTFGRKVDVRVHGGPCGGSYGSRTMSWQVEAYATALSRATGRPVKLILTKEEHLATFTIRLGSRMRAKVGMKKDGTLTAVSGKWFVNTGYYSYSTQFMVAVGSGEAQIMARCPNWNLKPVIVCTNRNASGPVRGFGGQELKCALIPLLSLAMQKADVDPLEFFKKNFVKPGEGYFWRDGIWYTYRGADYRKAMDRGAERFGWKEKWKGWLKPSSVKGVTRRGVGVASHGNADVGEDSSEVHVHLRPDGTALINSNVTEHGTGQWSNFQKMVAEVLQLPLDRVTMTPSDTLFNPYEFGPAGSRGTYAIGSAMIAAAEDARKKLFEIIAPELQAGPDDLDTMDGMVFARSNPERKIPWRVIGADRTVTGLGRFEADYTMSNCMTTFVEVEVDTETGKVDLVRVVNATDVGRIIDPQGLEGQLNGCLGSGGIDSALFEEIVLDRSTGHILNANMIDYKWRSFSELPQIDNVVLETPFPTHRFHAVGAGEVATAPGPTAVLIAASNAVGTWLHEYPLTPDKILRALGKIPSGRKGGAL
ncbi:MAG TPA: xanthine dehydrogenase family protein molybdopterin-binding subunit [Syntrophorhabdaceae bacterium]|jgi:xanthine dehydrogenase molybdenum-binding subunit